MNRLHPMMRRSQWSALASLFSLIVGSSAVAQAQTNDAAPAAAPETPAQPTTAPKAKDGAANEPPNSQADEATSAANKDEAKTEEAASPTDNDSPAKAAANASPDPELTGAQEIDAAKNEQTGKEDTASADAEADADAHDEISDADFEDFLQESKLGEEGAGPTFDIYGFADFSYVQYLIPNDSPWRLLYNNKGAFSVGNLNVYFDSQITETIRSLAEIRFTYLPHGSVTELGPPSVRTPNYSSDYTRSERDVIIGGIRIERAWLQWAPHQLLKIKAGQWLTPYGIWNVDHGTPTIISVSRPFMVDEQLLPESQSGILAEGRLDLADDIALEYAAGISNGRGPIDVYFDYDANRGLSGRLKLLFTQLGELQVGVSGYTGKYTNAQTNIDLDGTTLKSVDTISLQYKEMAIAADVRWQYGGFLFQSEFALNDRKYSDEGRETSYLPNSLAPDSRRWGVYAVSGYRFDWFGVMPYAIGEFSPVPNTSIYELPREVVLVGGGLNIRPIAQVVFKLGYDQAIFPEQRPTTFDEHTVRRLQAQVAWAF